MGIELGDAVWNIRGDDTQLQEDVAGSKETVAETSGFFERHGDRMATGMAVAGAGIVAALTASAISAGNAGTELVRLSETTGMSIDQIETLEFASSQANVEFSKVERSIAMMTDQTENWIQAGEDTTGTLDELGISLEELEGMSPHERFRRYADGIAQVEDHSRRATLAGQVFGSTAGPQMLPLLEQGAAGLDAYREVMEEAGIGMGESGAAKAEEFADQMDILQRQIQQVWLDIGTALIPVLQDLMPQFQGVLSTVLSFIQENPRFIEGVVKWGGAFALAAMAIKPMIGIMRGLAVAKAAALALAGPAGWAILAGAAAAAAGAFAFIRSNVPDVEVPEEGQASEDIFNMSVDDLVREGQDFSTARHGGFHRGLTLVGEEGPELLDLGNRGGFITPTEGVGQMGQPRISVDLRGAHINDQRDVESLSQRFFDHVNQKLATQGVF